MAVGQPDNVQELNDFLLEVEQSIVQIQQDSENIDEDVLLQAELLLRDVVMVEGILHPPGGQVIVEAIVDMVKAIQGHVDEGHRQHIKGRPQIPI